MVNTHEHHTHTHALSLSPKRDFQLKELEFDVFPLLNKERVFVVRIEACVRRSSSKRFRAVFTPNRVHGDGDRARASDAHCSAGDCSWTSKRGGSEPWTPLTPDDTGSSGSGSGVTIRSANGGLCGSRR